MSRKPPPRPSRSANRKNSLAGQISLGLILLSMFLFMLPTVIFLIIGMFPTLVVAASDQSKYKYKWLCVGALNFAGALPFLFRLWFSNHSIPGVINELTGSVLPIVSMYGAAAAGLLIYKSIPPIVIGFMQLTAQRRISRLKDEQQALIEKWGEEVTVGNEPVPARPVQGAAPKTAEK